VAALKKTSSRQVCITPQLAVKRAVLNRLGNVVAQDFFRAGQVRHRPRHLQNPVAGAGAQIQIGHRVFPQFLRPLIQLAKWLQFPRALPGCNNGDNWLNESGGATVESRATPEFKYFGL
jgi:hypothetical protein